MLSGNIALVDLRWDQVGRQEEDRDLSELRRDISQICEGLGQGQGLVKKKVLNLLAYLYNSGKDSVVCLIPERR